MGISIPKLLSQSVFTQCLNGILILVILGSLSYLVTLLVHQRTIAQQDILELMGLQNERLSSSQKVGIQKPPHVRESDYQELTESLFFRQPNFVGDEKKKEKPKQTAVALNLYRALQVKGFIAGTQAILYDPATRTTLYVKEGDTIQEGIVVSIRPGKVTIQVENEMVELVF
jgi:hypothetical protein